MNQYFNPDISMLKEIPKAESEAILSLEPAADTTLEFAEIAEMAPEHNCVDQVMHMIQFARQAA